MSEKYEYHRCQSAAPRSVQPLLASLAVAAFALWGSAHFLSQFA